MLVFSDPHKAYLEVLRDVYHNYEYRSSPRGLPVREKLDYSFRVMSPSSEPIVTRDAERNVKIAEYTAKEMALYDAGTDRVEAFAKASKFWEKIANPDGTINSAYGHLIWKNYSCTNAKFGDGYARTPWEWARDSLLADRDTRQAILRFSLSEHQWMGNKDQVCTLNGNFLIRENRLNFSVVMRSNDVVLGLVYDLPWFCGLIDRMLPELRPKYPTLQRGTYTHFVHSIHCYERDTETILKMLGEKSDVPADPAAVSALVLPGKTP